MMQYEENEQIALFQWAAYVQNKYPDLKWLHHIPNGGARHKATAGRLKAAGVKKGVPDICLPVPKGKYHGLYIEMKYGKNKPSPDQIEWLTMLRKAGYQTGVCYSCEKAIEVIKVYLRLKG